MRRSITATGSEPATSRASKKRPAPAPKRPPAKVEKRQDPRRPRRRETQPRRRVGGGRQPWVRQAAKVLALITLFAVSLLAGLAIAGRLG
jgi:hypothetical protein